MSLYFLITLLIYPLSWGAYFLLAKFLSKKIKKPVLFFLGYTISATPIFVIGILCTTRFNNLGTNIFAISSWCFYLLFGIKERKKMNGVPPESSELLKFSYDKYDLDFLEKSKNLEDLSIEDRGIDKQSHKKKEKPRDWLMILVIGVPICLMVQNLWTQREEARHPVAIECIFVSAEKEDISSFGSGHSSMSHLILFHTEDCDDFTYATNTDDNRDDMIAEFIPGEKYKFFVAKSSVGNPGRRWTHRYPVVSGK